jgi:hypothetical protein
MAFPTEIILYQKNDQYIEIDGIASGLDGSYMNTATVTATLVDSDGAVVGGIEEMPLAYVAASDGQYRGQIQETFNPAVGTYTLIVEADQGGIVGHWEIKCKVKVRKT